MTSAERIALWADRLCDISAMGLLFSKNIHDETGFRNVQTIAMEMYALATGEPMEQIEPLRATVFSRPTPPSVGDAAVIDKWFSEDELPDDLDPGHRTRIPEAFRVWHGDSRVFFDRPATT